MLLEFDGTFIVIGVSFIIFMIAMQKVFYGPMFKIKKQRQNYIGENEKHAHIMSQAAKRFIQTHTAEIKETKTLAKEVISEAIIEANNAKQKTLKECNEKALEHLSKSKSEIEASKQEAEKTMDKEVLNLAQAISTKILGEHIPIAQIDTEAES